MPLVKPDSIQRHPLAWGLLWAALTLGFLSLIALALGKPLPNLWIAIPIWVLAGAGWGYAMKRRLGGSGEAE